MTKRPSAIQKLAATAGASVIAIGAMMGTAQAENYSHGGMSQRNADYNDGYREGVHNTGTFYAQTRSGNKPDGMNVIAAILESDCDNISDAFCSGEVAGIDCVRGEVAVGMSQDGYIRPVLTPDDTDMLTARQHRAIRAAFLELSDVEQHVRLGNAEKICKVAAPHRSVR